MLDAGPPGRAAGRAVGRARTEGKWIQQGTRTKFKKCESAKPRPDTFRNYWPNRFTCNWLPSAGAGAIRPTSPAAGRMASSIWGSSTYSEVGLCFSGVCFRMRIAIVPPTPILSFQWDRRSIVMASSCVPLPASGPAGRAESAIPDRSQLQVKRFGQ